MDDLLLDKLFPSLFHMSLQAFGVSNWEDAFDLVQEVLLVLELLSLLLEGHFVGVELPSDLHLESKQSFGVDQA